jgi:hypothetical protein
MNILDKKDSDEIDKELEPFFTTFHLPKVKANLKGSSLYKYLLYKSDFDLLCIVERTTPLTEFFIGLSSVLQKINLNPDMYLIELKYETKANLKVRMHPGDIISQQGLERYYDQIKFIKIDTVVRVRNKFYEISCIYHFKDNIAQTPQDIIKQLEDDIVEFKEEHRYYKVLKRLFSISVLNKNINMINFYIRVFNSELGKQYEKLCNLQAIQLLEQYYKDDSTREKINANLKLIHESNKGSIDTLIKRYSKVINNESKNIYDNLKK